MQEPSALPDLALARVLSGGGPYRPGDEISVAFMTHGVGRLVAHDASVRAACLPVEHAIVPEMISVVVTHPALTYLAGDVLTLSFVDPRIARIYSSAQRSGTPLAGAERACETASAAPKQTPGMRSDAPICEAEPLPPHIDQGATSEASARAADPIVCDAQLPATGVGSADVKTEVHQLATEFDSRLMTDDSLALLRDARSREMEPLESIGERQFRVTTKTSESGGSQGTGVVVRLEWSPERLRRFVQIVDKLFTIDRLGWYRHALAMRLLIPDDVHCGNTAADVDANRHLHALRGAAIVALGKPLLAACMPNFVVTSEWLASIESAAEARAIAGFRSALLPFVEDNAVAPVADLKSASTVGVVTRRELLEPSATSVDAFLPMLIANVSHDEALSRRLADYRYLLLDLFGQTAGSGELVRLNGMAQPNHSLDDRLWQLVGAVSEAFDHFALA